MGVTELRPRERIDERARLHPHSLGRLRTTTFPLYAGGFLGPFGGAMLVALIPTVAAGLDTSVGLVAAAITAYMVPFAALQLVSGTIGERLGGARVVRAGYLGFGAAALVCAAAPEIWSFMAGRALMGASNAFLTPILLAALSEAVPARVLGRSVGTFAAVQVAGLTLAPVLGGALGEISWRLAFALVALVSFTLALHGLTVGQASGSREASLRDLANRWIGLVSLTAAAGYLGFTAIGFVVALVASRSSISGPEQAASSSRVTEPAGFCSAGTPGAWSIGRGGPARRSRGRRLRRRRARDGVRAHRLGARARLLRGRLRRRVRLGRTEHDRGRVVPREPGRGSLGLQRVQVRRGGDRTAHLRPPVRSRYPSAVRSGHRLLAARLRARRALAAPVPDNQVSALLRQIEYALDAAHGLADTVLVLDEREADEAVAARAEADPRADGDLRLPRQHRRELERAGSLMGGGNRCPDEHRRARLREDPARASEAVAERITARAVDVPDDRRIVGGLVHRDDGRDLDRLEGAVVEVRLEPASAWTTFALPSRNPTRQPAIENDFVSV